MSLIRAFSAALCFGLPLAGACQTAGERVPAHFDRADEATLSRVKAVLAEALDRQDIRLGAGDPSHDNAITVLPPPLGPNETHSPAMPVVFDIVIRDKDCYLEHRETGERYRLDGITCVAGEAG